MQTRYLQIKFANALTMKAYLTLGMSRTLIGETQSLEIPHFIGDLKYITTVKQVQEYFREKFPDEKNKIQPPPVLLEGAKQLAKLQKASNLMPDLLQEMKNDILSDQTRLVREFFVLPSEGASINGSRRRFVYFETQHDNLLNKIALLEEYGFVIDITPRNTPMYRMTDELIDLLISTTFAKTAYR